MPNPKIYAIALSFAISFINAIQLDSKDTPLDAHYFLDLYKENLKSVHKLVLQGSKENNPLVFRGYSLIDYSVYRTLSQRQIRGFRKPLVFFRGVLVSEPVYSEYGGVSIDAVLQSEYGDKNAKRIHLNFDGRYFSDLLVIGEQRDFYALCAIPLVNRCLLLGIGEKW